MPQCLDDDVQEAVVLPCRPGRQVKVKYQHAAWQVWEAGSALLLARRDSRPRSQQSRQLCNIR